MPSFAVPLWRSLIAYRFAALAYAGVLVARNFHHYAHPVAGWPIGLGMVLWTIYTANAYRREAGRRWPLLTLDLVVTVAGLLSTRWVVGTTALRAGVPTISVAWMAGPALAWAIAGGRRLGAIAALVVGAADVVARGTLTEQTLAGPVLTVLTAAAVGYLARLGTDAEARLQRAVELEAATRERERLARQIHDSVLQVLALVQRRGTELGGDAAELGRLAGEQEVALRTLVSAGPPAANQGQPADLRVALAGCAVPPVSLATPATPVLLDPYAAHEIAVAVTSALDNVGRHAGPGARAWVLVEDDGAAVTVSVRDDGVGFAPGRLAAAAADGRLGIAQSIRGRIRDLGGTVTITSAPGQGTEVELRVPVDRDP
jgi:signal transduction histidine kinase